MIIDDLNKVFLVYVDENGKKYDQPVADVVTSGTLVSPETGDDMEIVEVFIEAGTD